MRGVHAASLLSVLIAAPLYGHQQQTQAPVVLAPGYAALEYAAPAPGSYHLPILGPAADAEFIDSRGRRGHLHELLDGRVTILSFIYTQCDDVNGCPLATYVMGQIARRLERDARVRERLRLVSFSFDLEHDTPAVLEKYASSFRPPGTDWDFLLAPDADALQQTLASYQQSVMQSGGHAFAHILRVFLIDSSQRIRNIYSTSYLHSDTLASDIQTVLLEQGDLPADSATGLISALDTNNVSSSGAFDAYLGLPPPTAMNGPVPGAAAIELGERLFFDRRLSLNRTISCAMCHVPAQGFTVNELSTAVGIEGRTVKRNAPSLLNVGYLSTLFHDARENRLEQQVWAPLLAANEMGNPSIAYVIDNLKRWPGYEEGFRKALDRDISMESIGAALAAYQRSLIAAGSDFDRYYYSGETNALSDSAQRGLELFRGKARCSTCHTIGPQHALFTDEAQHNTGIGYRASMGRTVGRSTARFGDATDIEYDLAYVAPSAERKPNDLGRYEVTQNPDDRWKFRTPGLRNVALTRPYMHDGSLSTLDDVIDFYNRGGVANELLDPVIRPLDLDSEQRADLVAFLHSLTSPAVATLVERAAAVKINNPGETSP